MGMRSTIVILVALALSGCARKNVAVTPAKPSGKTAIEVMEVKTGLLERRGSYFGYIEPEADIMISAEVGGVIVALPVEKGMVVTGDALLARIDPRQYELAVSQAQAQLEVAKLNQTKAEMTVEIEKKRLDAGLSQVKPGVDAASARLRLLENGLRPEEKKQLKAALEAAEANLVNAEAQFKRMKELYAAAAATRQQYDLAEAAVKTARSAQKQASLAYRLAEKGAREEERASAQAALKQAEAAVQGAEVSLETLDLRKNEAAMAKAQVAMAELVLENAKLALSKTAVTSKLAKGQKAVVANRMVEIGESVGPGTPVFQILVMEKPLLRIQVGGVEFVNLKTGATIDVLCTGEKAPRKGTIRRLGQNSNRQNATFEVEIELDNRDGRLRSGLICEAQPVVEAFTMPLIPHSAISETQGGKLVVLEKAGIVREQNVVVAATQNAVAAISSGLAQGDRIVVIGNRLVKDGDPVTVKAVRKAIADYRQGDPESPWGASN